MSGDMGEMGNIRYNKKRIAELEQELAIGVNVIRDMEAENERLKAELAEANRIGKSWKSQTLTAHTETNRVRQVCTGLQNERDKLREAAKNFLADLEERVSRDGKHHPDEGVRDYLSNGKVLPIGNGVLFMLDEALKGET